MKIQSAIEDKISASLAPEYLQVLNESNNHNVPADSESHFKVTVVSNQFEDKSLLARHRIINALLSEELAGEVHALSIHSFTPSEWAAKNEQSRQSPPCLGGAKSDTQN